MPVLEGVFVARSPLCLAEQQVDYLAHDGLIRRERFKVEERVLPVARRLAAALSFGLYRPVGSVDKLAMTFATALERTLAFGYSEAQREIRELRRSKAGVLASRDEALRRHRERVLLLSRRTAEDVTQAVEREGSRSGLPAEERQLAMQLAASKAVHNAVLTSVGQTLNLARGAGASDMRSPPEYAMRSEQLDKATCDACTSEHGGIYVLDSDAYYSHLPPEACYGGGRCRGIMVFGDGPVDFRGEG